MGTARAHRESDSERVSEIPQGGTPWGIYTGQRITRRKAYHVVCDPEGNVRYRDLWLWGCVEFLASEGITAYVLRPADPEDAKCVRSINCTMEQLSWQN